jgi:hypothetical protein
MNMSDDEVFAFLVSGVILLLVWGLWVKDLLLVDDYRPMTSRRLILIGLPVVLASGLFVVLKLWASSDVRNDVTYLAMYLVMGMAWTGLGRWIFVLLGLSCRGDVLERGNLAEVPALCGAFIGLMACYAGANIGDGPGWWCVIFSGGLGLGAWLLAWLLLDRIGGIGDTISIDRQLPAAIRLAAFLVAAGVICGRAGAGDWHSASDTVQEFRVVWPLAPLVAAAVIVERLLMQPTRRTQPSLAGAGVVPAMSYLLWMVRSLFIVHWPVMGVRGTGS